MNTTKKRSLGIKFISTKDADGPVKITRNRPVKGMRRIKNLHLLIPQQELVVIA